jgi:hypothetical protein
MKDSTLLDAMHKSKVHWSESEVVAHLSQTRYEHIAPHNKYLFDLEVEVERVELRSLGAVLLSSFV